MMKLYTDGTGVNIMGRTYFMNLYFKFFSSDVIFSYANIHQLWSGTITYLLVKLFFVLVFHILNS